MDTIIKGIDHVNHVFRWVIAILLGIMSVVIFAQVIFRYVLEAPLPWSEELARYLMIWTTFIGAGLAVRSKALIGMEALVNLLPKSLQKAAVVFVILATSFLFLIMIVYGLKMIKVTNAQVSAAMLIPMSWPYAAIPTGAVLMIINTIAVILERIGGKR